MNELINTEQNFGRKLIRSVNFTKKLVVGCLKGQFWGPLLCNMAGSEISLQLNQARKVFEKHTTVI